MELLLITVGYPYKYSDDMFIKPEMPYLAKTFKKVHVMNTFNESLKYELNDTPYNVHLIPFDSFNQKSGESRRKKAFFYSFFHPFKLTGIFIYELFYLLKRNKFKYSIINTALLYLLNANLFAIFLNKYLEQNSQIKLVYTYWYKNETLAALICKKCFNLKINCITRTHGGDLYEFRQEYNYQPYKKWMDKNIDNVFFVSKAGFDYYNNIFARKNKNKYIISKLGIENPYNPDISTRKASNKKLNIISCSYMIPEKRINLIIESLSKINELNIDWFHIGDGAEKELLKYIANELLSKKNNIKYTFLGIKDNDSIKKYYNENYFDCFVSTTSTEGIPVTMMEAISFGIPLISSNVGGVPEIVNNETGILLDPDNCVEELINALIFLSKMSDSETETLRKSCRSYWENNYRAETQYPKFIEYLIN